MRGRREMRGVPDIGMEPGGKKMPSRGKLGALIPLIPGSCWARGMETVKDRISEPPGGNERQEGRFWSCTE